MPCACAWLAISGLQSVPVVPGWYGPVPSDIQPISTDPRHVQLDAGQVMIQAIPLMWCHTGLDGTVVC